MRRFVTYSVLIAVLTVMCSPVCVAESLSIAGIGVSIGTNKSKIFSDFQDYSIKCLADTKLPLECDSWIIVRGKTAPYTFLANVEFSDGRVSSVIKYFDNNFNDSETLRFFEIFHSVLSDMMKGSTKDIKVQAKEERQGGVIQKHIFLADGRRVLRLSYLDGLMQNGEALPATVTLAEELR